MLDITSIFLSINGECSPGGQGRWAVFIRFAGCTAHCSYCDTQYSWSGGTKMTPETVFAQAKLIGQGCKTVTLTGGEPLEQNREDLITLISLLVQDEFHISMETNGLHDPNKILGSIGKEVYYVADFKLPSAGPAYGKHSFWSLKPTDYIKFVIQTDEDYKEAKNLQAFWPYFTNMFFSPCLPMTPKRLFDLMRRDGLTYIGLNIQLHKYIWPTDWREEEK